MNIAYNISTNVPFVSLASAFGRCISTGFAIIDIDKACFLCVSDNYARLTNSYIECIIEKKFEWFDTVFDQESIKTLKLIKSKIEDSVSKDSDVSEKDLTFTCVLRLKEAKGKNALIQYTVTPIRQNPKEPIHMMLTTIQYTHFKTQGHLEVSNTRDSAFIYDDINSTWIEKSNMSISNSESDLIALSLRGFSRQEIADKKFVTSEAVKSQKHRLFSRMNVASIEEAIGKLFNTGLQKTHWLRRLKK